MRCLWLGVPEGVRLGEGLIPLWDLMRGCGYVQGLRLDQGLRFDQELRLGEGVRLGEGMLLGEGLRWGEGLRLDEGLRLSEWLRLGEGVRLVKGLRLGECYQTCWGNATSSWIETWWGLRLGEGWDLVRECYLVMDWDWVMTETWWIWWRTESGQGVDTLLGTEPWWGTYQDFVWGIDTLLLSTHVKSLLNHC